MNENNSILYTKHNLLIPMMFDKLLYETSGIVDGCSYQILVTNKRLIFASKKFLRRSKKIELSIKDVKNIYISGLWIFKSLTIDCGFDRYNISIGFNSELNKLKDSIEMAMNESDNDKEQ